MKICKVKPDKNHCMCCLDTQIAHSQMEDCSKCPSAKDTYELISVGTERVGLFGSRDYAMVLRNGRIQKVDLDRVYAITEVRERRDMVYTITEVREWRDTDDGK